MTKRTRSEEDDAAWEETKEPWFFWGLEQQRWIDAIVTYFCENPMTITKFYFQIAIWPHVTIPPTIGPEYTLTLEQDKKYQTLTLFFRVKLSIRLWKQLRLGCCAFLREVMHGVAIRIPDFEVSGITDSVKFYEKTHPDYAKCLTTVKKRV